MMSRINMDDRPNVGPKPETQQSRMTIYIVTQLCADMCNIVAAYVTCISQLCSRLLMGTHSYTHMRNLRGVVVQ